MAVVVALSNAWFLLVPATGFGFKPSLAGQSPPPWSEPFPARGDLPHPDPEDGATGGLLVKLNGNIVIDLGDIYGTAPRSSKYLRVKADRLLVSHCYQ
jgi:hypothetical protein